MRKSSGYDSSVFYLIDLFLDALILYAVIWTALILVIWFLYIVQGAALYKIAKRERFTKWWLAWIPVVHLFMIPLLTEQKVSTRIRGKFTSLFGVVFAVSLTTVYTTKNMWFLCIMIVPLIYGFCVMIKPYSKYYRLHAGLAVLSLGISIPFQLLRFSRKDQLL